jgi:hypothetical protein
MFLPLLLERKVIGLKQIFLAQKDITIGKKDVNVPNLDGDEVN